MHFHLIKDISYNWDKKNKIKTLLEVNSVWLQLLCTIGSRVTVPNSGKMRTIGRKAYILFPGLTLARKARNSVKPRKYFPTYDSKLFEPLWPIWTTSTSLKWLVWKSSFGVFWLWIFEKLKYFLQMNYSTILLLLLVLQKHICQEKVRNSSVATIVLFAHGQAALGEIVLGWSSIRQLEKHFYLITLLQSVSS